MGKPKGLPKTGGRKAGTPNKASLSPDVLFESYDFDVVGEFLESVKDLKPSDKTIALLKFMEFVFPKKKSLESFSEYPDKKDQASSLDLSRISDSELKKLEEIVTKASTH